MNLLLIRISSSWLPDIPIDCPLTLIA